MVSFNDKQRLIVDKDIEQFIIYFEAIFDHAPTTKCFTEYLYATFNSESCQFLESVNEFRKVKHERKRLQMAMKMYEQFIADGANTQLNLRSDLKNRVIKILFPDPSSASGSLENTPPPNPCSPHMMGMRSRPSLDSSASNDSSSADSLGSEATNHTNHTNHHHSTSTAVGAVGNSTPTVSTTIISSPSSSHRVSSVKSPSSSSTGSTPEIINNNNNNNNSNSQQQLYMSCPKTLFDEIESMVMLSLKENNFKAFVESDHFKNYLKRQPLKILYEIGSVREDSPLHFVESLGDLTSESFSLNDFKFVNMQLKNYDPQEWELIGSSSHHKCYFSTKSYDMGDSVGLNFFKFDCEFPFPIKHVMNTMFEHEYRLKYDGNLSEIKPLNYVERRNNAGASMSMPSSAAASSSSSISSSSGTTSSVNSLMASSITKELYKLGWPLAPREFIVSSSGIYDTTSGAYVVGKKSCVSSLAKDTEKGVIRALSLGGWAFKELSPNSTRYSQLFYLDFKGNIPRAVVKSLLKDRAKNFLKLGTKYIKLNEKRGWICNESDGMWRTIEENGSVAL